LRGEGALELFGRLRGFARHLEDLPESRVDLRQTVVDLSRGFAGGDRALG